MSSTKKEIPDSGNWIRFTTTLIKVHVVQWTENLNVKTKVYWLVTGRWAKEREDVLASEHEVDIFIAEEYIDSRYKGQNPLQHVANFQSYHEGVVEEKLDKRFFYGQSRDKTRRFIVYQPMERSINQGRFIKSTLMYCVEKAGEMIPEFHGVKPSAPINGAAALVLTAFGDRLKQFQGLKDSKVIELNIKEDEKDVIVTTAVVEAATSVEEDLDIPEEGHIGDIPDFFGKAVSMSVLLANHRKAVE